VAFPKPFYRWRPHPWHGLEIGPNPPHLVYAYIELTPDDTVKYEVDKVTGYLHLDRPQRTSSQPPALYGFIPRTYCGRRVGALSPSAVRGDGDPLDICVVTERPVHRSEFFLNARVVGGLQVLDNEEADDKIIAVLENDHFWGHIQDISELPEKLIERLRHYFLTYKLVPGEEVQMKIEKDIHVDEAVKIVEAAIADYEEEFLGGN